MTTVQDLIDETALHLYSGERDELNILTIAIDNSETTIALDNALGGIRTGSILAIDTELLLVTATPTTSTATVRRGYLGSAAAAHVVSSLVWVNPKFSEHAIFTALQHEFRALSSPTEGLFRMKSLDITRNADDQYPFAPTDLTRGIYDIRAKDSKPYDFARIPHFDDTGAVLRVSRSPAPKEITVRYRAKFTVPSAVTDDVLAVTGLHDEAHDIPPMGAALRLVHPREVKRGGTEAQTDARRAEEVPPGTTLGSARFLAAARAQRIAAEVSRLDSIFPPLGT